MQQDDDEDDDSDSIMKKKMTPTRTSKYCYSVILFAVSLIDITAKVFSTIS